MAKLQAKIPTLDLHGYKTDEVFDAIEAFMGRHANATAIRIMSGKGTGAVRSQVIDYLKKAKYPWRFEELPNGAKNEGVLVVHME